MDLKEAKLTLGYQITLKDTDIYSPVSYEAVETILQELDNLQKENESIKARQD